MASYILSERQKQVARSGNDTGKMACNKPSVAGSVSQRACVFCGSRVVLYPIADAAGVPPFVVFSDVTLAEMARTMPKDSRRLLQVSGVGEHKLQKYGKAFLDVVNGYCKDNTPNDTPPMSEHDLALTISETQKETLRLYREGLELSGIAARRGLKNSTIAAHLEELQNLGADIDLLRLVDTEKVSLIQARLAVVGPESLSELREGLPDTISYEDIRFVRGAALKVRT
jgi:ATP-dependent DNA helicase RecQ